MCRSGNRKVISVWVADHTSGSSSLIDVLFSNPGMDEVIVLLRREMLIPIGTQLFNETIHGCTGVGILFHLPGMLETDPQLHQQLLLKYPLHHVQDALDLTVGLLRTSQHLHVFVVGFGRHVNHVVGEDVHLSPSLDPRHLPLQALGQRHAALQGFTGLEVRMPVDHQFSGRSLGEIVPQGLHVIPAVGSIDDSLHAAAGQIEPASGVFPSRQHSLEGVHRLRGQPPPQPSGTGCLRPVVGGPHVVRLEVEIEIGPVEPEPQLSGRPHLTLDLTGCHADHFIVRQDRVEGSCDLARPARNLGAGRKAQTAQDQDRQPAGRLFSVGHRRFNPWQGCPHSFRFGSRVQGPCGHAVFSRVLPLPEGRLPRNSASVGGG